MTAELRWILAALSAVLLGGIWWWGARRSRQLPGNAQLREQASADTSPSSAAAGGDEVPASVAVESAEPASDWGVPPFEPLCIRTTTVDDAQLTDLRLRVHPDPLEETFDMSVAERDLAAARFVDAPLHADHEPLFEPPPVPVRIPTLRAVDVIKPPQVASPPDQEVPQLPETDATAIMEAVAPAVPLAPPSTAVPTAVPVAASSPVPEPPAANRSEAQRIVAVRISAAEDTRWSGMQLLAALEAHGLAHGRYQVFHRKHSDGRTLFCAASLVEPGTFDLERMPQEEFRGLTLFAVLPGPVQPVQSLDALIDTALRLASALQGIVQDAKGAPLTQQRADALREEVARFQASLTMA